jgi:hypothetical protein
LLATCKSDAERVQTVWRSSSMSPGRNAAPSACAEHRSAPPAGWQRTEIWAAGIRGAAGIRHRLDLLVTGLAIGGGIKPLHDLISNVEAAKISKKHPSQTQ